MAVALRLTHQQFLAAVRGHYGLWQSGRMKTACDRLRDYLAARNDQAITFQVLGAKEVAMVGAWATWAATEEFRSVDSASNGVCTMMAVEMGAIPGVERESLTTAIVLYGEARTDPRGKQVPRVDVSDKTVPAYMDYLSIRRRVGVVLVDAFGEGSSAKTHGFTRRYGNQQSTVMENIKNVLRMAKKHQMPIFNVTMGASRTWSELSDHFSSTVIDIVKPHQPLFSGDERYRTETYRRLQEQNVEYLVVMGWDANQCVAAAIFGVERSDRGFTPGLLDHGWNVVTARNLLGANETGALESKWGWPHVGASAARATGISHGQLAAARDAPKVG
jgi:hypothetical protein